MAVIKGSAKPHTTVSGTAESDLILAPGAFSTITGGGGNDVVIATGGYSTFVQGSLDGSSQGYYGDGVSGYTDSVTLGGSGNTVTGGDGNFTVTDLAGGQNTVRLGNGSNTVLLAGTGNFIEFGGGQNNVTFLGGGNAVLLNYSDEGNVAEPNAFNPNASIAFSGAQNRFDAKFNGSPGHSIRTRPTGVVAITGGTGGATFNMTPGGTTSVVTGGAYNTITQAGGTGDFTPGSGYDTVILQPAYVGDDSRLGLFGTFAVHLAGMHNKVVGTTNSVTVDGGAGSSSYDFAQQPDTTAQIIYQFGPLPSVKVTAGGSNNVFRLLDANTNTVVTGAGNARVTIVDVGLPPGFGPPAVPTTLTFAGLNNRLDDNGDGIVNVSGGTGQGTFNLGRGTDTLTTGGSGNKVTAGAGTATVTPGSDHATVTLNGTNAHLFLSGDGNAVFLNAGSSGTIEGASPNLHVTIAPGIGAEVIKGLMSDPKAVFTLTGGAGGYASTAQVAAALQSDGNGGTLLPIGAGFLDFAGVAPSSIPASMFVVKP